MKVEAEVKIKILDGEEKGKIVKFDIEPEYLELFEENLHLREIR